MSFCVLYKCICSRRVDLKRVGENKLVSLLYVAPSGSAEGEDYTKVPFQDYGNTHKTIQKDAPGTKNTIELR
jgi:hypothetical protein